MGKKKSGLYRELIIHPGETLKEVLETKGMSQRELAIRTDVSETHISNIIGEKKGISVGFAKKLEYALSIDSGFWINLQANYDRELTDYEEVNGITKEELNILKNLKHIIKYLKNLGYILNEADGASLVIEIRKLLNISTLLRIPDISGTLAYRLGSKAKIDDFVLFAWLRICDLVIEKRLKGIPVDLDLLKEEIPVLKSLMFEEGQNIVKGLENILEKCGINFLLAQHFEGAPVQGIIKSNRDGSLTLIMTNRQKFADIFWFSFFHEIAHILNGDVSNWHIECGLEQNEKENMADALAAKLLLDSKKYRSFVKSGDFSIEAIESFSEVINVPPFILIGQLQKEGYLNYSDFPDKKRRYEFF